MINQNIINDLRIQTALTKENLQIIACAGSGKTEFISHRIAYIVAEKIARPENIVAFTFTEKAAEELKFRIRSKIRGLIGHQPDIGDIYVGTIHSFCYELLKEFVPEYRAFDVLDESKRFSFISSILQKDKNILSEVQKRFTYITVDEYQDVNLIQERPIKLLAGKENNICVVGDDDQSVYQWRGSTVDNIINFKERYPKVFTHHLPTNFRSTDGIIFAGSSEITRKTPMMRAPEMIKHFLLTQCR